MRIKELTTGLEVAVKRDGWLQRGTVTAVDTSTGTVEVTVVVEATLSRDAHHVTLTVRPSQIKMPWAEWAAVMRSLTAPSGPSFDAAAIEASLAASPLGGGR